MHGQGKCVGIAQHDDMDILVLKTFDILDKVLIIKGLDVINTDNDVATLQATGLGDRVGHHIGHDEGRAVGDEVGVLRAQQLGDGVLR